MTQILFYHLNNQSLGKVLHRLLERSLERDWRVAIQCKTRSRLDALDTYLWTFSDESFLPHAAEGSMVEEATFHPIWLTIKDDNLNNAHIRFLIDNAEPPDMRNYERCVFMFEGSDLEAVSGAHIQWKALKCQNHELIYWQQNGRNWIKKTSLSRQD
ncbi:DNA polymerase III subunit chi [Candidatus Endowatersipora endosymbiont of Watersipora subatra]|uniref:DNA polymerase III subunit chi n=1 Tax=Candidatus Endowatersipora endosymbiont of Watersipora subatra TaxID=3077946 RepID=UPI00312CB322